MRPMGAALFKSTRCSTTLWDAFQLRDVTFLWVTDCCAVRKGYFSFARTLKFGAIMPNLNNPASSVPSITAGAQRGFHGFGAFATQPLPAQAVLGVYEGQRYLPEELATKDRDQKLTYLFSLSSDEKSDDVEGNNETRHLNHACSPNCEAFEEYDENGRLVLKFQTIQPVEAGDELFIDYNLVVDESFSPLD